MNRAASLLASLSLLVASFGVGHAQSTDLTAEALQNATYRPVNPLIFGEAVQLVDGGYSKAGTEGGISQRSTVFGDLNGDGVDDAVVVMLELLGCCASSINVALAAYVNDSGVPSFVGTVPLGRASDVQSVTVDSGVITVDGLKIGPSDAFCCPKQPFELQLTLQGNQLVDASGAGSTPAAQPEAPASTDAGSRSTPDLAVLRPGFSGQVLIPSPGLQPFASLWFSNLSPQLQIYSDVAGKSRVYPQSYSLMFLDPNPVGQFGTAGAQSAGATARQMYDDTAADLQKTYAGCTATAAYCARPTYPACRGIPCTVRSELFRGLKAKGSDALVEHVQYEKDWGWSITWFDPQAGVSYSLSTANGADPAGLDKGLSANNKAGADQLAALASQLVPWTGP